MFTSTSRSFWPRARQRVNQGFGLLARCTREGSLAPAALDQVPRLRRLDRFHGRDLTADLAARSRAAAKAGRWRRRRRSCRSRVFQQVPRSNLLRERHRVVRQIPSISASRSRLPFRRLDQLARHAEARASTDKPCNRCVPSARDDAEIHFRLPEWRLRNCHAMVPGHRQLQPAAEAIAVYCHDDRLRAVFDRREADAGPLLPQLAPGRVFEHQV